MNQSSIYLERIKCYVDTKSRVHDISPPPKSIKISNKSSQPLTVGEHQRPLIERCLIEDMDSLRCAVGYLRMGYNPVVLNLADDMWPGGSVENGSGAQEESLFRCTNLCATLKLYEKPRLYPIEPDELIYSADISVIKNCEAAMWGLFHPPYDQLAIISCPGLKFPTQENGRLSLDDEQKLQIKIRLILRTAVQKGHDMVVLGALGCGAWRNPASHVAQVFFNVMEESEFKFCKLKLVVFAIMKTTQDMYILKNCQSTPSSSIAQDNYDIFINELNTFKLNKTQSNLS